MPEKLEETSGVVIDGERYGHRPGHSIGDTGECAHWCEACRLEREDRKADRELTEETVIGIDLLRRLEEWCAWQREDHWLPEDGRNPTITQIILLHSLCMTWGVETPEDLANHSDRKARAAWTEWDRTRGQD